MNFQKTNAYNSHVSYVFILAELACYNSHVNLSYAVFKLFFSNTEILYKTTGICSGGLSICLKHLVGMYVGPIIIPAALTENQEHLRPLWSCQNHFISSISFPEFFFFLYR